jgi:hypothetical protein
VLSSSGPLRAKSGPDAMSDLSPLCTQKRTSADHCKFIVGGSFGLPREDLSPPANFLNRINDVCLSSPFCKNILVFRIPKSPLYLRRPGPDKRGVSRSSRTLGAGCDGRNWRLRRERLIADGEVVWSRRLEVGVKPAEILFAGDGVKKARSPGRARSSQLKPSRAGMSGNSGGPRGD